MNMNLTSLVKNIPLELAAQKYWIVYKLLPPDDKGKIQKIPINPTSSPTDPTSNDYNDPECWMSLKGAMTFIKYSMSYDYGVGFFFHSTNPFIGIDFDHCLDEQGNIIDQRVKYWVTELDSYTEVSVSGTGLHVIVRGEHPKGIRRAWAEIYPHGRFFAITGDTLADFPLEVRERQEQVTALAAVLSGLSSGATPPWPGQDVSEIPPALTLEQMVEVFKQFWVADEIVMHRMANGRAKREIGDLMRGDTALWKGPDAPYPTRSEADAALMLYLADYTNCNQEQMMRIFKASGLDRSAEKPDKYYEITMDTAMRIVISRTRPELATLDAGHMAFLLNQAIDDGGHARCLEYLYGDRFLNVAGAGWMQRGDTHWSGTLAEPLLTQTTETLLRIRATVAERHKLDKLEKASAVMTGRVRAVEYMFSSYTAISIADLDKDPFLVNTLNGVVDLRTGELILRTPSDRFTYCINAPYIPTAVNELWNTTLFENVAEDRAVYEFLQRAIGYSFTGNTREEKLFYIFGPARSGKGIFTQTLQALMGSPLFAQVDFGVLTGARTEDRQNFALAPLKPARLVSASESTKYEKLNEATVKSATGRDAISCAFKYQTPFSYTPQFKVWLTSNHPPSGDVDDDAFWGRIATIHFPKTHLGAEDVMLKETFEMHDALTGILAWCIQGAISWVQSGLQIPGTVLRNTQQHRSDQDLVRVWLEQECIEDPEAYVAFEDLYVSYKNWCLHNGSAVSLHRVFSKSLSIRGFTERANRYVTLCTDPVKKVRACVFGLKLAHPTAWASIKQPQTNGNTTPEKP